MKFTKNDIENKSLICYLSHNCPPVAHRREKNCLVNIYESETAIEMIQAKIKTHKLDGRYNKFVPLWKNHIKILKELK